MVSRIIQTEFLPFAQAKLRRITVMSNSLYHLKLYPIVVLLYIIKYCSRFKPNRIAQRRALRVQTVVLFSCFGVEKFLDFG